MDRPRRNRCGGEAFLPGDALAHEGNSYEKIHRITTRVFLRGEGVRHCSKCRHHRHRRSGLGRCGVSHSGGPGAYSDADDGQLCDVGHPAGAVLRDGGLQRDALGSAHGAKLDSDRHEQHARRSARRTSHVAVVQVGGVSDLCLREVAPGRVGQESQLHHGERTERARHPGGAGIRSLQSRMGFTLRAILGRDRLFHAPQRGSREPRCAGLVAERRATRRACRAHGFAGQRRVVAGFAGGQGDLTYPEP